MNLPPIRCSGFLCRPSVKRTFAAFVLLAFSTVIMSQPTDYGISLTGGRVIPVNGSRYEAFTPTFGVSADLYWQKNDQRYWTQYWHHPFFGLHAGFAFLQGDLVGNRLEVGGLVQAPIAYGFSWNFNVGFSFYTKPYSRTLNEENIFIGSYLNVLISAGFLYEIPRRDGTTFSIGGHVVHSSNGYTQKPNRGLNFIQLELGCRLPTGHQQPEPDTILSHFDYKPTFRPYLSISPSFVMSRNDPIDVHKYYFAYTLQGGLISHFHPCFSFGVNADMMYNYAHRKLANDHEAPVYWGLSAFGESHWGPITLRMGAGHYLDYYWQNWEQWYLRMGVYYSLGNRQRLGVAMKVHYDHIDYIEWTYMIEI
ncbi:MAG: acyloxyacyl hydrolase [Bacteroidales bacterium]|nr:acyloxyacyl hydrolase [Bacteroidales bacterium]